MAHDSLIVRGRKLRSIYFTPEHGRGGEEAFSQSNGRTERAGVSRDYEGVHEGGSETGVSGCDDEG